MTRNWHGSYGLYHAKTLNKYLIVTYLKAHRSYACIIQAHIDSILYSPQVFLCPECTPVKCRSRRTLLMLKHNTDDEHLPGIRDRSTVLLFIQNSILLQNWTSVVY